MLSLVRCPDRVGRQHGLDCPGGLYFACAPHRSGCRGILQCPGSDVEANGMPPTLGLSEAGLKGNQIARSGQNPPKPERFVRLVALAAVKGCCQLAVAMREPVPRVAEVSGAATECRFAPAVSDARS